MPNLKERKEALGFYTFVLVYLIMCLSVGIYLKSIFIIILVTLDIFIIFVTWLMNIFAIVEIKKGLDND